MSRRSVVLPDPLGPSRVAYAPCSTANDTSETACTRPKRLESLDASTAGGALDVIAVATPAVSARHRHAQDRSQARDRDQHRRRNGQRGPQHVRGLVEEDLRERLHARVGEEERQRDLVERRDECEESSGQDAGQREGQRHGPQHLPARGAEREGRVLELGVDAAQRGQDGQDHQGRAEQTVGEHEPRSRAHPPMLEIPAIESRAEDDGRHDERERGGGFIREHARRHATQRDRGGHAGAERDGGRADADHEAVPDRVAPERIDEQLAVPAKRKPPRRERQEVGSRERHRNQDQSGQDQDRGDTEDAEPAGDRSDARGEIAAG